MLTKKRRKKKQKGEAPKQVREVPKQTTCPHCKGRFWAPSGKRTCPHPKCGKRLIVTDGVKGNMTGFYSKLLEGIAESGGISAIEIRWSSHPKKNPSDSREVEGENG